MKIGTMFALLASAAVSVSTPPATAQTGLKPDAVHWAGVVKAAGVRATFVHLTSNSAAVPY